MTTIKIRITKLQTEIKITSAQMTYICSCKIYKTIKSHKEQQHKPLTINIHPLIKVQVKTKMIYNKEMKVYSIKCSVIINNLRIKVIVSCNNNSKTITNFTHFQTLYSKNINKIITYLDNYCQENKTTIYKKL